MYLQIKTAIEKFKGLRVENGRRLEKRKIRRLENWKIRNNRKDNDRFNG